MKRGTKKQIKVRDLKPTKDAKGGRSFRPTHAPTHAGTNAGTHAGTSAGTNAGTGAGN